MANSSSPSSAAPGPARPRCSAGDRLIEADIGRDRVEGEASKRSKSNRARRRIGYVFHSGGLLPSYGVAAYRSPPNYVVGTPQPNWPRACMSCLTLVRLALSNNRDPAFLHDCPAASATRGVRVRWRKARIRLMTSRSAALEIPYTANALGAIRALHRNSG